MPDLERLLELQAECFADDIEFPEAARTWTEAQAREFFNSAGQVVPNGKGDTTTAKKPELPPLELTAVGSKKRFKAVAPKTFTTTKGIRIAYQLSVVPNSSAPPVVVLGGGQSGRDEACSYGGAEANFFAQHTVLVFDRRNTCASDFSYEDIGTEPGQVPENHAQADDTIELLDSLAPLGPKWLFYGISSGARLLSLVALRRPDLVKAFVLNNLTGGHGAAEGLSAAYYSTHVDTALRAGMDGVLQAKLYRKANEASKQRLLAMEVPRFVQAMRASAGLYFDSKGHPALALSAADLASIRVPVIVVNTYGDKNDGAHTPEVAHAVAAAIPGAECVVSDDMKVWLPAIVAFVERVSRPTTTTAAIGIS